MALGGADTASSATIRVFLNPCASVLASLDGSFIGEMLTGRTIGKVEVDCVNLTIHPVNYY